MIKFFTLILTLFPAMVSAFEWEGGVREIYLTRDSYSYNSDTNARIMRELVDRGHKRISLEPRFAWTGDARSLVYMPVLKTSHFDMAVANTRILQAGAHLTLRPIIYESPDMGEAMPIMRIRPLRTDLTLISYGQLLAQYTQLSRTHEVDRLVVGSGLAHLLAESKNVPRFEELLKNARRSVGPKTEVVLEIVGTEDLKALIKSHIPLKGLVDGLSVVLDPQTHFPGGVINPDELRKTRLILESILPGLPVHLSRVVIPACSSPTIISDEFVCSGEKADHKLQLERFLEFKKTLLELEEEGINFGAVEILEANTDYEPKSADPRYPYYNPLMRDPKVYELPVLSTAASPPWPIPRPQGSKQGCIYFDKKDVSSTKDSLGEIHAMMLHSLLGAFPSWNFERKKLEDYTKGELNRCKSVFYLATNFGQVPPDGFIEEMATISKKIPVVWFNYKISLMTKALKEQGRDPGFDVSVIIQPDSAPSVTNPTPGFYSQFDYKGETFFKLSKWNPISNNFEASAEINLIEIKDSGKTQVLAHARHDKTNKSIPYAVNSGNIWYVADSPFSFVHYEDRFYIFCDFLWDILGETPPEERIALVRIEDVNPKHNYHHLKEVWDYLASENVPFAIALIPFYSDLFGNTTTSKEPSFSPITKFKSFVGQIKYAINRGADIIMHGTIHSVGCLISGYDGVTAADYEFWLYPQNSPLPFDSVDWVTRRLELGIKTLQELGIRPTAFEAPHYAASVLDYLVFGKMFQWQYHRSIYMPHKIISDTGLPRHLRAFECRPSECGEERRKILSNIKVTADYSQFSGINSPFITHNDIYGQSIIPETLGMVDYVFYPKHTWRPVSTPEDIIRRARKLKVIRGAVASFFWHPLLLDPINVYYQDVPGSFESIGGKRSLSMIIQGLKELGYVFKSTSDKTLFPEEMI